jgi:hypothetical protein
VSGWVVVDKIFSLNEKTAGSLRLRPGQALTGLRPVRNDKGYMAEADEGVRPSMNLVRYRNGRFAFLLRFCERRGDVIERR